MPLKRSSGNMYPWVTHMHAHLGGECPHKCAYCYVSGPRHERPPAFSGPLRLLQGELAVDYGENGKVIFIDHANDLWADAVPTDILMRVLAHCRMYPANQYVFQTKNPVRYLKYERCLFPPKRLLGCTIETNWSIPSKISQAPNPHERYTAMRTLSEQQESTFITLEPIMDFDVDEMLLWIARMAPDFVNIGADSKKHDLPEPSREKVIALVTGLRLAGIEIREKRNLTRLVGAEQMKHWADVRPRNKSH